MPYIDDVKRPQYDEVLEKLPPMPVKGDMEYCIFKIMQMYRKSHEERFSDLHDCTYGAIHCGDEFRRRFLDKREDVAREKNGDVEC